MEILFENHKSDRIVSKRCYHHILNFGYSFAFPQKAGKKILAANVAVCLPQSLLCGRLVLCSFFSPLSGFYIWDPSFDLIAELSQFGTCFNGRRHDSVETTLMRRLNF